MGRRGPLLALALVSLALGGWLVYRSWPGAGPEPDAAPSAEDIDRALEDARRATEEETPELALPEARALFLEVLSGAAPVAGARVSVLHGVGARAEAVTDVDGLATLEAVGPVVRVEISASGYAPLSARPALPPSGDASWTAQLTRLEGEEGKIAIRGLVLCDDLPHEGAAVALTTERGATRAVAVASTDAQGRFAVETEVPLRELAELIVHSAECGEARAAPRADRDLQLRLSRGGRLRARVLDAEGRPAEAFTLRLKVIDMPRLLARGRGKKLNPIFAQARPERAASEADVDAEGWVSLGPLAADRYQLLAHGPGARPVVETVELRAGETASMTVRLGEATVIAGRVTDAESGAPLKGVRIQARVEHARRGGYAIATTDGEGRYRLTTEPLRRQSLRVSRAGYIPTEVSAVEGAPGEIVERDVELLKLSAAHSKRTLSYVGVGAQLRQDGEYVQVLKTYPNGPAAEVLREGDRILEVDGAKVRGTPLRDVVESILGEEGEPVELRIEREGETRYVELTRSRIVTEP